MQNNVSNKHHSDSCILLSLRSKTSETTSCLGVVWRHIFKGCYHLEHVINRLISAEHWRKNTVFDYQSFISKWRTRFNNPTAIQKFIVSFDSEKSLLNLCHRVPTTTKATVRLHQLTKQVAVNVRLSKQTFYETYQGENMQCINEFKIQAKRYYRHFKIFIFVQN